MGSNRRGYSREAFASQPSIQRRQAAFSAINAGMTGDDVTAAAYAAQPSATGSGIVGPRDHDDGADRDLAVFGSLRKDTREWLARNVADPERVQEDSTKLLGAIAQALRRSLGQITADLCCFYAKTFGEMGGVDLEGLCDDAVAEEAEQEGQRIAVSTPNAR